MLPSHRTDYLSYLYVKMNLNFGYYDERCASASVYKKWTPSTALIYLLTFIAIRGRVRVRVCVLLCVFVCVTNLVCLTTFAKRWCVCCYLCTITIIWIIITIMFFLSYSFYCLHGSTANTAAYMHIGYKRLLMYSLIHVKWNWWTWDLCFSVGFFVLLFIVVIANLDIYRNFYHVFYDF